MKRQYGAMAFAKVKTNHFGLYKSVYIICNHVDDSYNLVKNDSNDSYISLKTVTNALHCNEGCDNKSNCNDSCNYVIYFNNCKFYHNNVHDGHSGRR